MSFEESLRKYIAENNDMYAQAQVLWDSLSHQTNEEDAARQVLVALVMGTLAQTPEVSPQTSYAESVARRKRV